MTDSPALASLHPRLIGGPTIAFDYGGLRILTDPTFDQPGSYSLGPITLTKLTGPAIDPADLGRIDAVLLSHDQHPDNLDTAGRAMLAGIPSVLSTQDAAARMTGVTGVAPWQSTSLQNRHGAAVRVTAVPALHGPEGAEAVAGAVTGFVLEADGSPTVYVSGDNASVDLVREIADRFTIDIAVLFAGAADTGRNLGGPLTLTAEDVVSVAGILSTAMIVPIHIDGWAHLTQSAEHVAHAAEVAGVAGRFVFLAAG